MFVRGISEVAELFVAIKRLQEFMLNEEFEAISKPPIRRDPVYTAEKEALKLKDLTVKWNERLSDTALDNITLKVNKGSILGIIGPVGSGKSSLLQTILGKAHD